MAGRPLAAQQPGRPQQQRPRANTKQILRVLPLLARECHPIRVNNGIIRARPAGHAQQIAGRRGRQRLGGQELQSAIAPYRIPRFCDKIHGEARRVRQDLIGAGHIQLGQPFEQENIHMHDDAPSRTPTPSIGGRAQPVAPQMAENAPQRVLFVLFDGFQPLDLAGPWQAFSSANEEAGKALYQLTTIAAERDVSTWEQGLRMQVDGTFEEDGDAPVDMLLVPGGPGVDRASAHAETRAWLRRRAAGAARPCRVCTGAFVLAAAALLNGLAVTTHWRSADRLRQITGPLPASPQASTWRWP
ncbi:hypothetical protein G6F65_017229 [Rhizopus arrhizus]|nr:hypothetical protein G6F65_017229 [Rhizopus arrhizus]